ncbi:MAG: hypothetical protein EOO01_02705 [Chitinophagaceae bacterium]|nr:MAG: hypothetical protein EOO01_02705 [Chitinophagaceae bacterium]
MTAAKLVSTLLAADLKSAGVICPNFIDEWSWAFACQAEKQNNMRRKYEGFISAAVLVEV